MLTAGSSPLARGLPGVDVRYLERTRIIPARAGFTDPMSRPSATVRDHPRSRGVYHDTDGPTVLVNGSSPLARGLQRAAYRERTAKGIIPARAGFT